MKKKLAKFLESDKFQRFIVALILINSILIGLETSPTYMKSFGYIIDQIDLIILGFFVLEITLKMYAMEKNFFRSTWNIFDMAVILISIIPSAGSFAVLRALRVLRTLRLLTNIPKLKIIIESLVHAVPSIGWISVLLIIIYYIFAVIGTNLFGVEYPKYFGTLGDTMYTLFQIMTLESWSSAIARPILESSPFAAIYFVVFILIATYTTLNIFIAIVVNTMNELHRRGLEEEEKHIKEFVHNEHEHLLDRMSELQVEIRELKDLINSENKTQNKMLTK